MRRTLSVTLSTLSAILLFSACGNTKGGGEQATGVVAPEIKRDPVELVFYYPWATDWNEETFNKTFADPIKQKYPYITPKLIVGGTKGTSISELVAAGQQIDVVFASIGTTPQTLLEPALQYDISPIIKKFGYDLNKIDPTIIDLNKKMADGGMYGLPVYVPPSTMYYNKDLFDKFGVAYPKDGMTWDELFELSKKMTRKEGDVQYLGFISSFSHMALMNQRSLPLVDTATKKATFDTKSAWKPYIDNITRFYQLPGYEFKVTDLGEGNQRNKFFKDRTVGMWLALTKLHDVEVEGMNWDLASYPVFKDSPTGPQPYPVNFYITSTSKYKDQAFEAISYLTTEEMQAKNAKDGKLLPVLTSKEVRQSFGQNSPLYKGKNVKALLPEKYAPAGSVNKYNPTGQSELDTAIRNIIVGAKDANTALREAAEATNKKIAEMDSGGK